MKVRAGGQPILALGVSLVAHVLFLLLVPYESPRPTAAASRQLIPIRLLEQLRATREPAIEPSTHRPAAPAAPTASDAPEPRDAQLIVESPTLEANPLSREIPLPNSDRIEPSTTETAAVTESAPDGQPASAASGPAIVQAPVAAPQAGTEIAAYQAILSTLRGRIVANIRYPAIARANGWEGTVVVAVRLDAAGRLVQAIVRHSSGHEVLDRAAAALLKRVTPVANPLSLPVTIEIPIVYELR
jgi:protein TonB